MKLYKNNSIKMSTAIKKFKKYYLKIKIRYSRRKISKYESIIKINDIKNTFRTRNEEYQYFHHFFWNLAPTWLREHRNYFTQNHRGFGEAAFHSMWFFLFKEFNPKNVLEIGIYRGQTISLFALLSKFFNINSSIHGISPFSASGDSVSVYLSEIDYYNDVLENIKYFDLPIPALHRGFSTDDSMVDIIKSKSWDLIYIDGNHDYEVVKVDYHNCIHNIKPGGLLVFDDSSLYTDFTPPFFSSAGHPGPSKVANEIDVNLFKEILSVGHNRVFIRL